MNKKGHYTAAFPDFMASIFGVVIFSALLAGDLYLFYLLMDIYLGRDGRHTGNETGLVLLFVFAVIFITAIVRSINGIRSVNRNFEVVNAQYDLEKEPWMARDQWRHRRIETDGRNMYNSMSPGFRLLFVFILFCVFSLFFFLAGYSIINGGSPLEKILYLGICILILAGLIYFFLMERIFGRTICHLKTLPTYVGQSFEGEIEIEFPRIRSGMPALPSKTIAAEVQFCVFIGGNKNKQVIVRWRSPITVAIDLLDRPGDGTLRIPLSIPISESYSQSRIRLHAGEFWRLQISSWFGNLYFRRRFTIPVFEKAV